MTPGKEMTNDNELIENILFGAGGFLESIKSPFMSLSSVFQARKPSGIRGGVVLFLFSNISLHAVNQVAWGSTLSPSHLKLESGFLILSLVAGSMSCVTLGISPNITGP